jgi:L-fuconolactonase
MAEARDLECIDAHHHLWHYDANQYPWMTGQMSVLRHDFLMDDLLAVARDAGVTGSVAVQARQTIEETKWLSKLAEESDFILGVVGWAPLIQNDIEPIIESMASLPKVKAMRHVLHDEPDDFYMLRGDFNRGVSFLKNFELVYDLLVFERHLPQTIEFVDRHPGQTFVLDHIAKPKIREGQLSPWREKIRELAKRENVYCKISGVVTEANWADWAEDDLDPYFEVVLDAFGPNRLMFGSDWPVVTLASPYQKWLRCVRKAICALSANEQRRVLCETAIEAYKLDEK